LIGRCENGCERDYNENHHPNNYDCVNYQEVNFVEFEIQEAKKLKNYLRKFVLDSPKPNSSVGELLKKVM